MRAVPDPVGGRRGRGKASGPDATTKLLNQPLQGSSTLGLLIMEKKSSLLKLLEWGRGAHGWKLTLKVKSTQGPWGRQL